MCFAEGAVMDVGCGGEGDMHEEDSYALVFDAWSMLVM